MKNSLFHLFLLEIATYCGAATGFVGSLVIIGLTVTGCLEYFNIDLSSEHQHVIVFIIVCLSAFICLASGIICRVYVNAHLNGGSDFDDRHTEDISEK